MKGWRQVHGDTVFGPGGAVGVHRNVPRKVRESGLGGRAVGLGGLRRVSS